MHHIVHYIVHHVVHCIPRHAFFLRNLVPFHAARSEAVGAIKVAEAAEALQRQARL